MTIDLGVIHWEHKHAEDEETECTFQAHNLQGRCSVLGDDLFFNAHLNGNDYLREDNKNVADENASGVFSTCLGITEASNTDNSDPHHHEAYSKPLETKDFSLESDARENGCEHDHGTA